MIKLLNDYVAYLKTERLDSPIRRQLLLRVEQRQGRKLVYIGSTTFLSNFKEDVPSAYAELGERFAFIYAEKPGESFGAFYDQFASVFEQDIKRSGDHNPEFSYDFIHHTEIWRVCVLGSDLHRKEIFRFPGFEFFEEFEYDDQGRMTYKDGVFHESQFGEHSWLPTDFDLRRYLLETTSVTLDLLENSDVDATLVIDEKGDVIEAIVDGLQSEGLKTELSNALMGMRQWIPAQIQGKPAKVRIVYGL